MWTFSLFQFLTSAGKAAYLHQRTAEQEFDLRVDTAQIIPGPTSKGFKHLGIGAQQEGLALTHV